MFDRNFMGDDGFFWFIGRVESRQDPLAAGRIQVRVYGTHSPSLTDIPSEDLPWASTIEPLTAGPSLAIKEGDLVVGFWADGYNKQIPVIMGKLNGYVTQPNAQGQGFNDLRDQAILKEAPRLPQSITYKTDGSGITVQNPSQASLYPLAQDLNKPILSGATRNDIVNTVIERRIDNLDKNVLTAKGLTWSEPHPGYNPLYPYNKAYETESGHIIEYDDTPGYERITFTHRTGSFIDLYPTGSRVDKITKSKYEVVLGDDYVHVMGRALVSVGEGCYIKVLGDANIEVDNSINLTANGDCNMAIGGAWNVIAKSLNFNVEGDATTVTQGTQYLTSQGQVEVQAGGSVDIVGSTVNIEESVSPGTPNALQAPGAPATPNRGVAGPEATPVPWAQNYQYLNAYTATAAKHASYLDQNGVAPDANVANTPCNFDDNVHTWISSSDWAISQNGLLQIQHREGYGKAVANGCCQAYPDPVLGPALLTIGYGTTNVVLGATDQIDPTTVWTQAQAQQGLLDAINNIFLPYLQQVVTVNLTQNMIDAMLSFMYNVGVNNFSKSSVLKYTNQQNWCVAGHSFTLWNKRGGTVIPGLNTRRQSERSQYLT